MSVLQVVGLISFCLSVAAAYLSNVFTIRMLAEINRQRPANDQMSSVAAPWHVHAAYRDLYPDGTLPTYSFIAGVFIFIGIIGFAACFGFF